MPSRHIPFYIVTAPGCFEAEKIRLVNFLGHLNQLLAMDDFDQDVVVAVLEDEYCAEDCLRFFCRPEHPITMVRDTAPSPTEASLCFSYSHMDTLFLYVLLCLRTQGTLHTTIRVCNGSVHLGRNPAVPLLYAEPFVHHPTIAALNKSGADQEQVDEALGAILFFCLKDMQARMGDTYSEYRAAAFAKFWKGDCASAASALRRHESLGRRNKDVRYQVEAHYTIASVLATQLYDSANMKLIKRHFRYIARYLPHESALQAYTDGIKFLLRFNHQQEAQAILNVLTAIDERPHSHRHWRMLQDYVGEVKPDDLYYETTTALLRELNPIRVPTQPTLLVNAYRAHLTYIEQTGDKDYTQKWCVMHYLAHTLQQQGDFDAAISVRKAIYTGHCAHFGENDTVTLGAMRNLACSFLDIGDAHTCVTMLEELYARHCAAQGDLHPDTLVVLSMIADTYQKMNDTAKQIEWLERLYEAQCRAYGPNDENTLAVRIQLDELRSDNT